MNEWVSMAQQKPKKRGLYLVWCPTNSAMGTEVAAHYSILNWTGSKFRSSFPASHWMKLPEPPK